MLCGSSAVPGRELTMCTLHSFYYGSRGPIERLDGRGGALMCTYT